MTMRVANQKMRILCISGGYLPDVGGMQYSNDQTLSALYQQGVDVTLIIPEGKGSIEFDRTRPFRIIRYGKPGYIGTIRRMLRLSEEYKKRRYHRVMIMGHDSEIAYGLLRSRLNMVPVILAAGTRLPFENVWYKKMIRNKLLRRAYEGAGLIVAISDATIHFIREYCHQEPIRFVKVPRPIDEQVWDHHETAKPHKDFVVVTTSRLEKAKNIQGCLHVVKAVRDRIPDIRYVVVGDGECRDELEELAESLGVKDIVMFVGNKSPEDIAELYNKSDIFLMLSERGDAESFGRVYIEAAAMGIPSIGFRTSGVVETIINNETGYLVEPGDLDRVCEVLLDLYQNPAKLINLSKRAYSNYKAKFTKEIVGRMLKDALSA